MTPPSIPHNAYTHSPEQHPNLLLGSLHLLFWLIFRPLAWENHLKRLDPSFAHNFSWFKLFQQQRWQQKQVQQFFFQSFILLPILASLTVGVISLSADTPLEDVAFGVVEGAAFGVWFGILFGEMESVKLRLGNVMLGMMLGTTSSIRLNVISGIAFSVGFWINWWRPALMSMLFIPWHFLIYRIDDVRAGKVPSQLHRHLAFWDEWQYLKISGLDKHLLLVLERSPEEGQAALNYLSTSRQRWAAQSAQIELDARQLENCSEANEIADQHQDWGMGTLTGPADIWFRSFSRISADVAAALNQASTYNQRLAVTSVNQRLNSLCRELIRSSDKYAVRFRPIATRWYNILELHLAELAKISEQTQEIDSPYIIGVPLTEHQEIFTGRTDISARIEQLLLDRRRPPLLLYGQRRTGKTSLLNNLGRLLPQNIVPLFVDLQGPAARASNHAGFLYNLAKGMIESAKRQRDLSFPALSRAALADDPFTTFDEWLDQVETSLANNTALLALDEFEVLDKALTDGKFSENDVLGMLRNLIQQRPHFKVLIAGSHTLEEFQRWSSYLINAQVLHLGYLKASEARQLIEQPFLDFALRYKPEASQRVIDVTHCHPCLVQLLCAEIVALKNEQDPSIRRLATLADVETAIPEALSSGSMFFSDIERNQLDTQALELLRHIAAKGEGASVSEAEMVRHFENGMGMSQEQVRVARSLLLKRELIEETTAHHYRIQVELFRRWFAP